MLTEHQIVEQLGAAHSAMERTGFPPPLYESLPLWGKRSRFRKVLAASLAEQGAQYSSAELGRQYGCPIWLVTVNSPRKGLQTYSLSFEGGTEMYSLATLGDLVLRLQVVLVEQGGEGKMRTLFVTEVQVKELSFNRTFGFIRVKVKPRIDKTSNLILALGHDELCAFALQLTEAVGGTKLFCKVKKWRKRAKAAEKKAKRLEKLLQSERRRLFELGETG